MENLDVKEYLTQGDILSSQEKYEEAISYYSKAESIDKMNAEIYIAKGFLRQSEGEHGVIDKHPNRAEKRFSVVNLRLSFLRGIAKQRAIENFGIKRFPHPENLYQLAGFEEYKSADKQLVTKPLKKRIIRVI